MCKLLVESTGDAGIDSVLSKDLDCSVSEISEESMLLASSRHTDRRMGMLCDVRRTGLPLVPRPSFDGLPGAPDGSLRAYFSGTVIWQFSQTSGSESRVVVLGLLPPKLLSDEEKLGKYGLCVGERGLVGGVSNGDVICGVRAPSFSEVGWS